MKTTKSLLFGAVAVAIITLTPNLRASIFLRSDLENRAVAASPRAKEQFPWLTRQSSAVVATTAPSENVPAAIRNNRALAASPRMLELYPELARATQPSKSAIAQSGANERQLSVLAKNPAFAASPRTVELFPWLARGYQAAPAGKSFEVTPLK